MDQEHGQLGPFGHFFTDALFQQLDQQVLIVADHGQQIGIHVGAEFGDGLLHIVVLNILEFIIDPFKVLPHAILELLRGGFVLLENVKYGEFRHEHPDDIGQLFEILLIAAFFHFGGQHDALGLFEIDRFRDHEDGGLRFPDDASSGTACNQFPDDAASFGAHHDEVRVVNLTQHVEDGHDIAVL